MIGKTISHYRVLEKLGAGAMGEVYKAEDTRLHRQVALKFLSEAVSGDTHFRARFLREAQAASALNHPHICTIHDIGQHQGVPFLVMELLQGRTLRQRLIRGPLPAPEVLELAVQIAGALEAAHAKGILHRDIKSANIFVTDTGQAKILDFGLAKWAPGSAPPPSAADTVPPTVDSSEALHTSPGATLGTVCYMSPEQARGEPLDARSDLFSFGVVLYEMATGKLPFRGNTLAVIFDAILNQVPPSCSILNPEIPPELEEIINRALEKSCQSRYPSAPEMLADLRRVRAALLSGQSTAVRPARPQAAKPSDSIVVLPFLNMSADPENEYFGDGLAEELINALTKMEGLRVVARTSAFQFKGQAEDVQEIGRRLNVSTVLEGSVRKAGRRLRVVAQLINVADGYHLWSERYDRQMEDVFAVQDEITQAIVDALKIKLIGDQKQQLVKRYTENVEAYNLYLRGRFYWNKRTPDAFPKAIHDFQQALAMDPNYAPAHAGLADCYTVLGAMGLLPQQEAVRRAKAAALKALEIDGTLAEAHTSLGHVMAYHEYDWAEAERQFLRALELDPTCAAAYFWYVWFVLLPTGRLEEAAACAKRARELDPVTPMINMALGPVYYVARQYDRAIEEYQSALELDPNLPLANIFQGMAYAAIGQYEEAIAACERGQAYRLFATGLLGYVYASLGRQSEAERLLEDLREMIQQGQPGSNWMAGVYIGLGQKDLAFECLQRAYEERESGLVWLKVAPFYDTLRSDPRFDVLLGRMNLLD